MGMAATPSSTIGAAMIGPAAAGSGVREKLLDYSLILLVFLSFFENGLTILLDVKLRMIGFLILIFLFGKSLIRDLLSREGRLRGFEKAMLAWVGVGAASCLYDFRFGLEGKVAYALTYNMIFEYAWVMAYFAGKYAASRGADFRRIFRWTLWFGIVITGFAIFEKFFHTYIELYLLAKGNAFVEESFNSIFRRGYGYDESAYRCVSFTLEFIAFSYLCGVLALTFLVQLMETKKPVYLIGIVTSMSALFLTQSLSSLFACAIISLFYLFFLKRMRLSYLIYFGLLVGIFATALSFQQDSEGPFEGIQKRLSGVASGNDDGLVTHFHDFRFGVIDNFTWFGHGIGTSDFLQAAMKEEMESREYPSIEHEYFRILFEFGGVGLLVYLAAFAMTARQAYARYRAEADPWWKNMALICMLWLGLYLLVGFAHRSFPTYESSIFPALMLGFVCARGGLGRAQAAPGHAPEPALTPG